MSEFYNLPINLYDNLTESAEEIFGSSVVFDHDGKNWTILNQSEKVLGWLYFTSVGSFYDIELSCSQVVYQDELHSKMLELMDFMHEAVGSDQCKTGRCAL